MRPIIWPLCTLLTPTNPCVGTRSCVQRGPRGGGGTASLKVGTHCQITAPTFQACLPQSFLWPSPIFGTFRAPPFKIKLSQCGITWLYKRDSNYSIMHVTSCISQKKWKHILQAINLIRYLVWSWPHPLFAFKGVDHPYILAFTASASRGRLAVGSHLVPECPPPPPPGEEGLLSLAVREGRALWQPTSIHMDSVSQI